MRRTQDQSGQHNSSYERDFHHGNAYLNVAPDFDSKIVEPSQKEDQHDGKKLSELQLERRAVRSQRQRKRVKYPVQKREEIRQINKECRSQSRDGTAFRHPKLGPAIEKSP